MESILTVSQLTQAIKLQLEGRFARVTVKGEISNLKEQSSGHVYFTLKDQDSQISAVLFRGNAMAMSRKPQGGDQVIAKGELSVYAPKGNYQLIVRELQFAGVGELLLKLHELKQKLEALGWMDVKRKRRLPPFPKTIGVVTSPTGSVIQDIIQILNRRSNNFRLILNPVKVQGEGAALEIAQAIEQFNRHGLADLLIVGRGGGSLEDLWPFNEEIVAKAIFESKIPVISAVGHETDFTIADFVADVRAPTPSAAAEIALSERARQLEFLNERKKRLDQHVLSQLMHCKLHLKKFKEHPLLASPYALLGKYHQKFDDFRDDFDLAIQRFIDQKKLKLSYAARGMTACNPMQRLSVLREKFQRLASHLRAIDPKNLLNKGYCILFSEKNDSVILSTKEVSPEDNLRILLSDGRLIAKVSEVINHE